MAPSLLGALASWRLPLLGIVLLSATSAFAQEPFQFRGPAGSGVSTEKGLPVVWSDKDNLRWKANLPGRGLSNPVIANGKVFLTACTGPDQQRLHVLAIDLKTGEQLWERQFNATGTTLCHPKTNMAAPTPVTDGKHIFALFATGDIVCLDLAGDLVWYRSLVGDYPTVGNNVGMAASPALWRDVLLVCMENVGESFAVGINTSTGTNRWRIDRPRGINWVTPLVIRNEGRDEVIFQGPEDLSSLDPSTGKKLWSITGKKFQTIPSPTFGFGMVLSPADKFYAVRPGTPKQEAQIVWQGKLPSGYASPTFVNNRIYALTSKGVLQCADAATGKLLWDQRLEGDFAASPLIADGKIYVVSEEGVTTVLEEGAQAKILSSNAIGDKVLASPVAAERAVFLRSDKHLYCIGR